MDFTTAVSPVSLREAEPPDLLGEIGQMDFTQAGVVPEEEEGLLKQTGRALGSGVVDIPLAGTGTAQAGFTQIEQLEGIPIPAPPQIQTVLQAAGLLAPIAKPLLRSATGFLKDIQDWVEGGEENIPEELKGSVMDKPLEETVGNPKWWILNTAKIAPTAAAMIAGAGAGGLAGLAQTGTKLGAAVGGGGTASVLSGILEGGLQFHQSIDEGKSEEEAADDAFKVGVTSAGITAVTAGAQVGLLTRGGTLSKIAAAFIEPVEESAQQISSNIILGRDPFEGVADAALLSLPFGAGQSIVLSPKFKSGLDLIERNTQTAGKKFTEVIGKIKDQRESLGRPRTIVAEGEAAVATPEALQAGPQEEQFRTLADAIVAEETLEEGVAKTDEEVLHEAKRLAYEQTFSLEPDSEYHNMLKREAKKVGISQKIIEETTPLRLEDILSSRVAPESAAKKVVAGGPVSIGEADLGVGSRFRVGKKGILQYEVNEVLDDGGIRAFRVDEPKAKRKFKPEAQITPLKKPETIQPAVKKHLGAGFGLPSEEGPGVLRRMVTELFTPKGERPTRKWKGPPELEETHQAFYGVRRRPLRDKIEDHFPKYKTVAGDFPSLKKDREFFAGLRAKLHVLRKSPTISSYNAIEHLDIYTESLQKDLDSDDLFGRKVFLDDLEHEVSQGRPLPNLWTPELVALNKPWLDAEVDTNPKVQEAIRWRNLSHEEVRVDLIKWMKAIKQDISHIFTNPKYYRHQVMDHARLRAISGPGQRLRSPKSISSILRKRKGGGGINTNYIEADHEFLSNMFHDVQVAKTIKFVEENYDLSTAVKAVAKEKGEAKEWRKHIPEGYDTWQPQQGQMFFTVDTIPGRLAEKIRNGMLEETLGPESIRQLLAMGGPKKEYVLPVEAIEALNSINRTTERGMVNRVAVGITRDLKQVWIHGYKTIVKFFTRNMGGDAVAVFIGNPSTFKRAKESIRDLYRANLTKSGAMALKLRKYFERAGAGTTMQAQEFGELNKLEPFATKFGVKKLTEVPIKLFKGYWRTARIASDIRESILRYAAFLDFFDQMKKNQAEGGPGKPKQFGGALREDVMGIKWKKGAPQADIDEVLYDRAHVLSNKLLGAYDEVGKYSAEAAETLVPFWRFQATNMVRFKNLSVNAYQDGRLAEQVGKQFLVTTLRLPLSLGGFLAKGLVVVKLGQLVMQSAFFKGMLEVWNRYVFPEEENDLPEHVTRRSHINIPNPETLAKEGRLSARGDDGKVLHFTRVGVLDDLLEWVGLADGSNHVRDYLNGVRTLKEIGIEMVKSPLEKGVGLLGPAKMITELASKRQFFPDPLEPRRIRDRALYLAQSLGLENEYKHLFGLPARPYAENISEAFLYRADPGESAYSKFYQIRKRFLKVMGQHGKGYWESPQGDSLYNYRQAVRYGDEDAKQKYYIEYLIFGGTPKGIERSTGNLHPMGRLSKQNQKLLWNFMKESERKVFFKALRYYAETILGGSPPRVSNKRLLDEIGEMDFTTAVSPPQK